MSEQWFGAQWFGVSVEAPKISSPLMPCVVPEPVKAKPEAKPEPKPELSRRYGPRPKITARREEVLDLVVLGWSNAEIGRSLGLSELTVKNHVSGVLTILGARNRVAAAVKWALARQGEARSGA